MTVHLGVVGSCEAWRLESRFFPSKIGGKPAWLDLKNIPGEKSLRCDYCEEPCIFLCQIYAPYEENNDAFHRTIYIFVCKKPQCCRLNQNGNIKVFRSQLARNNQFYPTEPPVEEIDWRNDINAEQWVKTCYVCGILAPSHCSKCRQVHYCCRAHQVYDWKHGHKESCSSNRTIGRDEKFLFPEYEVEIEEENVDDEDDDVDDSEKEEEEVEKYKTMTEMGKAGTFQNEDVQSQLSSMANQTEDTTFSEFRTKIDKCPDQVLRYDRGGKILYISSEKKIQEIPRCSECNGERQFEFQIMPQLLNFLKFENALKSVDWGILVIFTCIKSCTPKNGYSVEYVWKQDITDDNSDIGLQENSGV